MLINIKTIETNNGEIWKGVNASKNKKSNEIKPENLIYLVTSTINLVAALIMLYVNLTRL